MAVLTIDSKLAPNLGYDARWKHWAKIIHSAAEINLDKPRVFAITSGFVNWGSTAAVQEGDFIFLASETGSAKYHAYDYALVRLIDGEPVAIGDTAVAETLQAATLPDQVRADGLNNRPYWYATYVKVVFKAEAAVAPVEPEPAPVGQVISLADLDMELIESAGDAWAITVPVRVRLTAGGDYQALVGDNDWRDAVEGASVAAAIEYALNTLHVEA